MKIIMALMLALTLTFSTEIYPISKTEFVVNNGNKERVVNLTGKNFIVISLRETGADGRIYSIDRDQTIWWSSVISSGAKGHRTPEGIYKVYFKKRFHMSTKYPDPSGRNNMNFSLFFHKGFALHQGNPNMMSHGCIHLDTITAKAMYNWSRNGLTVVVTKNSYMSLIEEDVLRIY